MATTAALFLTMGGAASAQSERSDSSQPADQRLYDLHCHQNAVRLLTERFVGPPKIELYGNFIVFSGPTPSGQPAVVIASEGSVCAFEDKH